jgi:hypothetical protein
MERIKIHKNEICLFLFGGLAAILGGVIDWRLGYIVTNYNCCFFAPAFSTLFSAVAVYFYIREDLKEAGLWG